jgi:transcriptional regulator with XRE-family HTH domain
MRTGEIISNLRKDRKWSQADLAEKTGISQVMVGKYERGDAAPSIEVAKNIADSFEVSLDYLVGKTTSISFDKKTLKRLEDLQAMEEGKRNTLFDLMDTYIRDSKARQAYAS